MIKTNKNTDRSNPFKINKEKSHFFCNVVMKKNFKFSLLSFCLLFLSLLLIMKEHPICIQKLSIFVLFFRIILLK